MKQFKSTLLLILLMSMASVVASAYDFVQNGIYYNFNGTDVSVTQGKYTENDVGEYIGTYTGAIIIPESVFYGGHNYNVTTIGNEAFSDCPGLTSVTIPNSVTSIGDYAFCNCTSLTSVAIPNSVTSIGDSAFQGCCSLTSVTIPNSVTSIGDYAFGECTSLTSVTIPNSVSSIGINPFICSNITSIVVEEGNSQFDSRNNCNAIIRTSTNELISGCKNTSIPNGVISIGESAFYGCKGLTSMTIPNSVTTIGSEAFDCSDLASVNIPNSVTSIGEYAFSVGSSLTSVKSDIVIPFTLGYMAFNVSPQCVLIVPLGTRDAYDENGWSQYFGGGVFEPLSVLADDKNMEYGDEIPELTYHTEGGPAKSGQPLLSTTATSASLSGQYPITVEQGDLESVTDITFIDGTLTISKAPLTITANSYTITKGEDIPEFEFTYEGFKNNETADVLISQPVTHCDATADSPAGVYEITVEGVEAENYEPVYVSGTLVIKTDHAIAFADNQVKQICVSNWDNDRDGELSLEEAAAVTELGNMFQGTTITSFNEMDRFTGLTSISDHAFEDCSGMTSITIPNSVTSIGDYAFHGCSGLASVVMGDNITTISPEAFPNKEYSPESNIHFYVNRGTHSLLSLWTAGFIPFEKDTEELLESPKFDVFTTQTTATLKVLPAYPEYEYTYNDMIPIEDYEIALSGLCPEYSDDITLNVSLEDQVYEVQQSFVTESLALEVVISDSTASSITFQGVYAEGDAVIDEVQTLTINGEEYEGSLHTLTGLDPDTDYMASYTVQVNYGDELLYSKTYTGTSVLRTPSLTLTTLPAKIVSEKDVIVSATSNLNDAETNVGFEWRRTGDDEDLFESRYGQAYLYEGTMEGFIRNLNVNFVWKFRPYYQADSGEYYYGEWKGIDLSDDQSYFEPTVHTYASIDIEDGTATVTGYAQRGSDEIDEEGFVYWEEENGDTENAPLHAPAYASVPDNAWSVQADGTLMEAQLTGLRPNTSYRYAAFVRTTKGETFYGLARSFTTGEFQMPTDVRSAITKEESSSDAIYDLSGRKHDKLRKGVNIIRQSDGTTRKVYIRR